MKIILTESVASLGDIGEVVDVRDGYARNWLLPKKLGLTPTPELIEEYRILKKSAEKERKQKEKELVEYVATLENLRLKIAAKVSEAGTLYGSVNKKMIVQKLSEQHEMVVEERHVELPDGKINTLGMHEASLRIGEQKIALVVEVEASEEGEHEKK